jgi:hypothetical protein
MRKSEIVITPIHIDNLVRAKMYVDYQYYIKKGTSRVKRALLNTLDVVEVSDKKEIDNLYSEALLDDNGYTVKIPLDIEGVDKDKLTDFFKEHPQFVNYNDIGSKSVSAANAQFVYTVSDEVIKKKNESNKERSQVYNKFAVLELSQKEAIAVHFGVSPFGLDGDELDNALVDFETGIINSSADNRLEFLTRFENIFDVKMINIKSAIMHDVITLSGDVYMLGGNVVGKNVNDIYANIQHKDDLNALIKRELIGKGAYIETQSEIKEAAESSAKEKAKKDVDKKEKELKIATT